MTALATISAVSKSGLIGRQCAALLALLAGSLLGGPVQAQDRGSTWYLVQPESRGPLLDPIVHHYVKYLPQYLGDKVVLQDVSRGQSMEAARDALSSENAGRTVVLMTPLLNEQIYDEQLARRSEARSMAVQLISQRPWCLASGHDLQPRSGESFMAWLHDLKRPIRIGMAASYGLLPRVWIKAMEHKTGVPWTVTDFAGNSAQGLSSLVSGQQDLLLETCPELLRRLSAKDSSAAADKVHVLLSTGDGAYKGTPTFMQWKLPMLTASWVAWFVSSQMRAEQRERVANALHAVALREDTQALIRELGQEPSLLSPKASQVFAENWLSNWKSVANWLDNLPADAPGRPRSSRAAPATQREASSS